jgi:hypothetical protein
MWPEKVRDAIFEFLVCFLGYALVFWIIHKIKMTVHGQIVCSVCDMLCPEDTNIVRTSCTRESCSDWLRPNWQHYHAHTFSHNAARTIDRENRRNQAKKYMKWLSCLDFNILDIVTE